MAVDMTKLVKLNALDALASVSSAAINEVKALATDAIKSVDVDGNTVKFYTDKTPAQGATPAYTVDFPAEMVLDQATTTFVDNFTFTTATYVGATNPNLDGKPVLVLGVKTTDAQGTATINYSFLNMYKLVDTYTVKAGNSSKILSIDGYEIEVKISATAGNIIEVKDDGIYVTNRVAGATENDVIIFDANGAPKDSGIGSDTLVLTSMIATDAETTEVINTYFGTNAGD